MRVIDRAWFMEILSPVNYFLSSDYYPSEFQCINMDLKFLV